MRGVIGLWRTWKHGRKFVKKGKGCEFPMKYFEVDGHVELGDFCRFRNNVILRTHGEGKIIFGNRSGCGYYVIIEANCLVQIGNFTGIGEFSVIRDSNHTVYGTEQFWRLTPLVSKPVIIGNECLIGSRVYISPGVTIGDGAVVDVGSVVTRDIGPYEIWSGVPARRVAHRLKGVPESRLRIAQEMMAKYGFNKDRYMDEARPSAQRPDMIGMPNTQSEPSGNSES